MVAEPFKHFRPLRHRRLVVGLAQVRILRLASIRLEGAFGLDASGVDELLTFTPPQRILVQSRIFATFLPGTGHLAVMDLLRYFADLRVEVEPVDLLTKVADTLRVNFVLHRAAILDEEVLRSVVAATADQATHVVDLRPETIRLDLGQVLLTLGPLDELVHLELAAHASLVQLLAVVLVVALAASG